MTKTTHLLLQAVADCIPVDRWPGTCLANGRIRIWHSNEDDHLEVTHEGRWEAQWFDRDDKPTERLDLSTLAAHASPQEVAACLVEALSLGDPTCETCGCWGDHATAECTEGPIDDPIV